MPGDGAEVAEEPYVWNCTFPPEEFDSAIRTRSFVKKGQVLGNQDLVIVYQYSCNTDKTYQSPERGYFFAPEEPLELSLRLECDAPCYAYLMRNGCYYDSTEACWFPYGSELTVATDLMPGLYRIGVEFVDADLEPPDAVHHFYLHAALNYVHGDSSCPCASVTSAGTLPPPQCDAGAETGPATQAVSGSLSWAAEDDFFLQCGHLGVAADKIGGMPDVVHAFDADFEGELPRLLDVRVTFPGQPGTGGPGHILALTTAPCGAPEAVIDCAWGSDGVLALEGLTVFPGERLYAVVDGMGADAFEAPAETAYEVQWSLRSPCP